MRRRIFTAWRVVSPSFVPEILAGGSQRHVRFWPKANRERKCVERMIGHLKINRAIATRNHKFARGAAATDSKQPALALGRSRPGREPIYSELSTDVRFGAHSGLKSDITALPKCAHEQTHAPQQNETPLFL